MNTLVNTNEQAASPPAAAVADLGEFIRPVVNIFETPDGYVLEAELPGVNKDGLSVSLEGTLLTLEGRRPEQAVPGAETLYRESRAAGFRRVFELDPAIDAAKISARIEQGILTLALPKAEAVKPRQIAVA